MQDNTERKIYGRDKAQAIGYIAESFGTKRIIFPRLLSGARTHSSLASLADVSDPGGHLDLGGFNPTPSQPTGVRPRNPFTSVPYHPSASSVLDMITCMRARKHHHQHSTGLAGVTIIHGAWPLHLVINHSQPSRTVCSGP
jgi:hypothetical protein